MEEFILLVEVASYLAAAAGILYGLYKYWEWLINKKTEEAKAYRAVMDAAVEDTLMQKRVVEETTRMPCMIRFLICQSTVSSHTGKPSKTKQEEESMKPEVSQMRKSLES